MKFKTKLLSGVLAGAMLALPIAAPAFAEPAYSANSNYVERVDWWHNNYNGYYRYHGYYGNGYYRGYGYPGWSYGSCGAAARLQNQAWRDRVSGHPAAGYDVAQQAAWARANCYRR